MKAWIGRGLVAMIVLAAMTRLWTNPDAVPAAAPEPATSKSDRVVATPAHPIRLSGLKPGQVRSMLDIREPMRFGSFRWDDSGVPRGPVLVRVDRDAQIISVFRGGHEIGTAVIMYGAPSKPTPSGRYPVLGKSVYHRSRLYDADMPFSVWLTRDGVALHASRVREGGATHGCIGLPEDFARKLFREVRIGDPVIIV